METPNTDNHTGEETAQWLKNNIVGQEITNITNTSITLKNGYTLTIECNEGCGACNNGWAEWAVEDTTPIGAVTNVECEYYEDEYGYTDEKFRIFIYLKDKPRITITGDDGVGNGCYGYGFHLTLTNITQ